MEETTHGIEPSRLAWLLGIGVEPDEPDAEAAERQVEQLLRAAWTGVVSYELAGTESVPLMVDQLCRPADLPAGKTPAQLLLDPAAGIDAYRAVKEYAKRLAARSRCRAQRAVATTLYYAAIASALRFADQRITRYTTGQLAEAFDSLLARAWLPVALADHLAETRTACGPVAPEARP